MKQKSVNINSAKKTLTQLMMVDTRLLLISIGVIGVAVLFIIFFPFHPRMVALNSRDETIEESIPVYTLNETPKFLIYTDTIVREAEKQQQSNKFLAQVGTIEAEVLDSDGSPTGLQPEIESVASGSSVFELTVPNDRLLIPGKLSLRIVLINKEKKYELWQDFRWDATVINFNQSSYTLGEAVQIGMGMIDTVGNSVCDASINLIVTSPGRERTYYNSKDKTVFSSNKCQNNEATNRPDFGAVYIPTSEGEYQVRLEARNGSESWTRDSSFLVTDNADFTVRYINTPLRIFPRLTHTVTMELRTDQSIMGELFYDIPSGLTVQSVNANGQVLERNASTDTIVWPINTKAGETIAFSFTFNAENRGSAIYHTGPLRITKTDKPRSVMSIEGTRDTYRFISPNSWEIITVSGEKNQRF